MDAVEDERLLDVVALAESKDTGPELVVLALEELGVVPQARALEQLTVDEHARVEEGRAEKGRPADLERPTRHEVYGGGRPACIELENRASDDRKARVRPELRNLPPEAVRQRHVVGIEARDVAARRRVECPIERRGEAEALVVPQDDQPGVVDLAEDLARPVGRAVVDDDQLEVGERLAEDTREREAQVTSRVVGRHEHGDERRGAHGVLSLRPVARPELPSFDLVLASVGRTREVARLLDSLEGQSHRRFRVLLVDQNEDERLEPVVMEHGELGIVRLRSERGLSRARNRALPELGGDVVAFPDDDCVYPADLLDRVARRFAADAGLDGLTGRSVDASGSSSASWKLGAARLTDTNLWNRAISYTTFLRRELVERVGPFDERLGLGAGTPWASGEEIEYLVRALRAGARIEYDPSLTVTHEERHLSPAELRARGYRDGASLGFILRKHGYPRGELALRLVRPLGGAALSLARGDVVQARVHVATLRGRVAGFAPLRDGEGGR